MVGKSWKIPWKIMENHKNGWFIMSMENPMEMDGDSGKSYEIGWFISRKIPI